MSSRKSLKKAALNFNPRAENHWSKDDSKFGQRMLEKMGWTKGEGIGRSGQGITENLKLHWKLDSKGLGFKIKEDDWVQVEEQFSAVLSKLSQTSNEMSLIKPSLESISVSLRSRVHYHKFIRSKDISKYSKQDLSGILGRNEFNKCEGNSASSETHEQSYETTNEMPLRENYIEKILPTNSTCDQPKQKKSKKKFVESNVVSEELDACKAVDGISARNEHLIAKLPVEENSHSMSCAENTEIEESAEIEEAVPKKQRKKGNSFQNNLDPVLFSENIANEELKDVNSKKKRRKKSAVEVNFDSVTYNKNVSSEELNEATTEEANFKKKRKKEKSFVIDNSNPVICVENRELRALKSEVEDTRLKERRKNAKDVRDLYQEVCSNGKENDKPEDIPVENESSVKCELQIKNTPIKKHRKKEVSSLVKSESDLVICISDFDEDDHINLTKLEPNVKNCSTSKRKLQKPLEMNAVRTIQNEFGRQKRREEQPSNIELGSDIIISIDDRIEHEEFIELKADINTSNKKRRKKEKSVINGVNFDSVVNFDEDVKNKNSVRKELNIESPPKKIRGDKESSVTTDLVLDEIINIDDVAEYDEIARHNSSSKKKSKKNKFATDVDSDYINDQQLANHGIEVEIQEASTRVEVSNKKRKKVKFVADEVENKVTDVDEIIKNEDVIELELEKECSSFKKKRKKTKSADSRGASEPTESIKPTEKCKSKSHKEYLVESKNGLNMETEPHRRHISNKMRSLDDFEHFMKSINEFNACNDSKTIIEKFEENKERLLHQYRFNYRRKQIESYNGNGSLISCELDGNELDCKKNEDDAKENELVGRYSENPSCIHRRQLTRAERIIQKARLLKKIQNDVKAHNFKGSNLHDISGYGNEII